MNSALLQVRDIHTYYGDSHVLQGVNLEVSRGEIVVLLGRHGAGKTTTLLSIMGIQPPLKGSIRFLMLTSVWVRPASLVLPD